MKRGLKKNSLKQAGLLASEGIRITISLRNRWISYYNFITDCFTEWLRYAEGVENISKWARNYLSVYKHYYDQLTAGDSILQQDQKDYP